MGAGAPKKYTKKTLEEAADKYFKSISRKVCAYDAIGDVILNDDGDPITYTEYVVPPSVSGLCLFLGIDRSTWNNYCNKEKHPEMKKTVSYVRMRMEAYLEEQLTTRQKNVQGIIFNLQNNYGWKDKKEVELGEKTRERMPTAGMTIQEKMAIITAAAEAMGDGQGGD